MRKFIVLICSLFCCNALLAQGYNISVQVKNYKNGYFYLGHYMGKQTYLVDSALVDANGNAVIKGTKALPGGIYMIVMPKKDRYFEILLDKQQTFSVSNDTADFIHHATFKNSPENETFYAYNKYLFTESKASEKVKTDYAAAKTPADTANVRNEQEALTQRIQDYRNNIIAKNPQSLLASIFKGMREPAVPPMPKKADGTLDSTYPYRYYKAHYWDDFNLSDGRLVRTPILETRLEKYFKTLVQIHPDSVIAECDMLISKAKKDREMYKYILWWCTYTYEQSQYMGFDAVFVHLVEKYYVSGQTEWLTEEQKNKIISRAYAMAPNLIGQPAAPLVLQDPAGKPISLYKIPSKYTVLVFWDPTCGHCKTEIPRIDSAYNASWKKRGVTILGIKTEGTKEEWTQYIAEHKLQWVNAWDPQYTSNYRRLYDVYSTPVVYLLDEKKKIVAKRLGVEQLDGFLTHLESLSPNKK
ncbi:uncharacterized protein DUF4369 [Chitinophaga skermanii]|uniref:Uncharacterized protein DUF4369 n=1 Tax=Chitinophaga skermanii TaxID=331697 RepID=A0A327QAD6_9BACT|nr:TlpA family protein disulfide reductase [Chitinophaga skermanii]RAI98766.1 uncharacterized protein DUF4369 [Chitinophaga skermanii]